MLIHDRDNAELVVTQTHMTKGQLHAAIEAWALEQGNHRAKQVPECSTDDADYLNAWSKTLKIMGDNPAQFLPNRQEQRFVVVSNWDCINVSDGMRFAEAINEARREYVRMATYESVVNPDDGDCAFWVCIVPQQLCVSDDKNQVLYKYHCPCPLETPHETP